MNLTQRSRIPKVWDRREDKVLDRISSNSRLGYKPCLRQGHWSLAFLRTVYSFAMVP